MIQTTPPPVLGSSPAKPVMVMLLTRDPFVETSGRAYMLRQRIEEFSRDYELVIAVVGRARTAGLHQIDPPSLPVVALNAARLASRPMQAWLCYSSRSRRQVRALLDATGASALYIDMIRLAPLYDGADPKVTQILDYDDLLSKRYARALAGGARNYEVLGFLSRRAPRLARWASRLARPLLAVEQARCLREERALLRTVHLALFTSATEAAELAARIAPAEQPPILAVPPTVRTSPSGRPPGDQVIFLGNLRYGENIRMVEALASALSQLDDLGELSEDFSVQVIGDYADGLPERLACRRLVFHGRLDNLADIADQGVFIAPVLSGSGVKLKILDGMALGCPVVTTPVGCEGLQARPNRDLLVRDDVVGVIRAAIALKDRRRLKARLSQRARAYLQAQHSGLAAEAMLARLAQVRSEDASPPKARTRSVQSTRS